MDSLAMAREVCGCNYCRAKGDSCAWAKRIATAIDEARLEEVENAPCPDTCRSNFGMGTLPCDCWKAVRLASLRPICKNCGHGVAQHEFDIGDSDCLVDGCTCRNYQPVKNASVQTSTATPRAPQGNCCTSVAPQPAYAPASVTGKPSEAGQWDAREAMFRFDEELASLHPDQEKWKACFLKHLNAAYDAGAATSNLSARVAEARLEEAGWWRSRIDGYDELFDGRIAELESAIDTPSKENKSSDTLPEQR